MTYDLETISTMYFDNLHTRLLFCSNHIQTRDLPGDFLVSNKSYDKLGKLLTRLLPPVPERSTNWSRVTFLIQGNR